jgi:D-alanyl-D-alanine endopeptidase (penicillin-binding protein 7)
MKFFIAALLVSLSWPLAAQPEALLLYNRTTNRMIIQDNTNAIRSIASITKIMTAMVAIDTDPNLDRKILLDTTVGAYIPRQYYSRRDLLNAMLVKSDNAAAETLARDHPGGRSGFIAAMNEKARDTGMRDTFFDDPSGLSRNNISTARDIQRMVLRALRYEFITQASAQKQILLDTHYGSQIRTIELWNTNRPLLFEFDNVLISKTGFTRAAGWCVAMIVDSGADTFVVVVLGSRDKHHRAETVRRAIYNHVRDEVIANDPNWSP